MVRRLFHITPPIRLEIGCGNIDHRRDGYAGLDIIDHGQAIVWDVEDGLPLPDASCSEIYASHVFEHLHQEKLIDVFNECWRALEKGGTLWVVVPSRNRAEAYIPSHLTLFDEATFKFFTGGLNPDYNIEELHQGAAVHVIKMWDIKELVTNNRGDIHCKMTPRR